jgi:putative CocE/NonD family hydrolase
VFESDVLTAPLTLLGAVTASLYVQSTATKTSFMILVQDVFPNDTIINIQEGGKQVSLNPNKTTKINLESWPTGYQLNPGHKLRIVIASSWFPRYNRSLNTEELVYNATESREAVQTIYLGPKHVSKITLPVFNPDRR